MARVPLPFLVAGTLTLALLAPAPARASPNNTDDLAVLIVRDGDPMAAAVLLGSPELQDAERARHPADFVDVFRRAALIRDVGDLLRSPSGMVNVRLGLFARQSCALCRDVAGVKKIAKQDSYMVDGRRAEIPVILLDWNGLTNAQRDWVAERGETEVHWNALDLFQRRERLMDWAVAERGALLKGNPASYEELQAMKSRAVDAYGILGLAESAALDSRLTQCALAVDALEKVRTAAVTDATGSFKRRLAEAEAAPDPQSRLAALARVFDGEDPHAAATPAIRTAVGGATSAAPGHGASLALAPDLIRTGIMKEVHGTWAGADMESFYARHPMKVSFEDAPLNLVAEYKDGSMYLNNAWIAIFVAERGKTMADFATDEPLLRDFVREIVPTAVHEARHEMQEAWAKERGLPFYPGEGAEKEALATGALFVLQKQAIDPSYRRYLEAHKDSSTFAKMDMARAEQLRESGAEWFGIQMVADNYVEHPSMAGLAGQFIEYRQSLRRPVGEELSRRQRMELLPRLAADAQPALQGHFDTPEQVASAVPGAGTQSLRDFAGKLDEFNAKEVLVYNAYADRWKQVSSQTDARLRELADGAKTPGMIPPPPSSGETPAAPGGGR